MEFDHTADLASSVSTQNIMTKLLAFLHLSKI